MSAVADIGQVQHAEQECMRLLYGSKEGVRVLKDVKDGVSQVLARLVQPLSIQREHFPQPWMPATAASNTLIVAQCLQVVFTGGRVRRTNSVDVQVCNSLQFRVDRLLWRSLHGQKVMKLWLHRRWEDAIKEALKAEEVKNRAEDWFGSLRYSNGTSITTE